MLFTVHLIRAGDTSGLLCWHAFDYSFLALDQIPSGTEFDLRTAGRAHPIMRPSSIPDSGV
jgi:hypothetical protein